MVHTIQLYTNISFYEKDKIEKRFKKSIVKVMEDLSEDTEGITITGRGKIVDYYINIHVDVTKILNKGDINEDDYYIVQQEIDRVIEYRVDICIESSSERYILFHIYKKMIRKFGFKERRDRDEYKTSVMYNSRSIQLMVYDKDEERLAKEEILKDYEKNMLRFEVKVLNNHLNYNKHKHNISKTLKNYFKRRYEK